MANFFELLRMGGYGTYVWSAYGLVLGLLAVHWFRPWLRWQKIMKRQKLVVTSRDVQ